MNLNRSHSFANIILSLLLTLLVKNPRHNMSWSFQLGRSTHTSSCNQKWQGSIRIKDCKSNVNHSLHLSSAYIEPRDVPAVLSIEYCTGCRWLFRSAWLMQELFTTFNNEMTSITLVPSKPPSPGGTFVIKLNEEIIWDRKIDNGFPEAKELKQRVRDKIAPKKNLGHSDVDSSNITASAEIKKENNYCIECEENSNEATSSKQNQLYQDSNSVNNLRITYCTGCRWMLRSSWMCQELLTTFETELTSVTLVPEYDAKGTFNIFLDDKMVWDRKTDDFPDVKTLKQRVRDIVDPTRNLGHVDYDSNVLVKENTEVDNNDSDAMSDDDAEDLRRFYGVM